VVPPAKASKLSSGNYGCAHTPARRNSVADLHGVGGGILSAADLANLEVQVSTNLVDWATLPDALTLTNGAIQLQDTGATNQPMRFYRTIESW